MSDHGAPRSVERECAGDIASHADGTGHGTRVALCYRGEMGECLAVGSSTRRDGQNWHGTLAACFFVLAAGFYELGEFSSSQWQILRYEIYCSETDSQVSSYPTKQASCIKRCIVKSTTEPSGVPHPAVPSSSGSVATFPKGHQAGESPTMNSSWPLFYFNFLT